MVERPSWRYGVVGKPSRRSGVVRSGQDTLPEVRERSRGPPGGPGVVGSLSRSSRSGREALSEVRSGREALTEVREWS